MNTARVVIAAAALCTAIGVARAECYIELRGSAAQFGFSRAGPYSNLSECRAMANRMHIVADCSCFDAGPTPEELELIRQQEEEARKREEARIAEERRLEAERERQRQITAWNSQGNDMLRAKLYDEAIRAYEQALAFGPSSVVEGNLRLARFGRAFAQGRAYFDGGQWDLAIAAYNEALTYRPGNAAAESNIRAAETNKLNQQIREEIRAKYETGFARIQSSIEDHVSFAEADRTATLSERESAGKKKPTLPFGDPDSATDQAILAKIADIDAKIEHDMQAIRNLGLERRAKDFEDWVGLARSSQLEFEKEFREVLADVAVDRLKDGFYNKLKSFDAAQAAKWVHIIEQRNYHPKPTGLIERLKLMGRRGNAGGFTEDAKLLGKEFEALHKMHEGHVEKKETLKVMADLLEIFVDDPRLKLLVAEIKVAIAASFNNATRRVAVHEVERLTEMTEDQLMALKSVQKVLTKHIKERRELKRLLTEPAS